MKRPSIKSPCNADAYHATGERIAEVSFPDGAGALISARTLADGTHVIDVYCTERVKVLVPPPEAAMRRGAAK